MTDTSTATREKKPQDEELKARAGPSGTKRNEPTPQERTQQRPHAQDTDNALKQSTVQKIRGAPRERTQKPPQARVINNAMKQLTVDREVGGERVEDSVAGSIYRNQTPTSVVPRTPSLRKGNPSPAIQYTPSGRSMTKT